MAAMNTMNDLVKSMAHAKHLITTYFPESTYRIVWERRDGVMPGTDLFIYNKAMNQSIDACIQCELYDEHPSILHIESLRQCGLQGRTLLNQLISFSKAYGILQITLHDGSRIVYTVKGVHNANNTNDEVSISLKHLRRLMTGQGWYETFGFTNKIILDYQERINDYLRRPISIYSDIGIYPNELIYRIQDYLSEINPTLADKTSSNIKRMSISEVATGLYTILTTVCPDRSCPNEEDLAVITDINDIIEQLHQGMLAHFRLHDRDFIPLTLTFPTKQNGSSRIHKKTRKRRRSRVQRKIYKDSVRSYTHGAWKGKGRSKEI